MTFEKRLCSRLPAFLMSFAVASVRVMRHVVNIVHFVFVTQVALSRMATSTLK